MRPPAKSPLSLVKSSLGDVFRMSCTKHRLVARSLLRARNPPHMLPETSSRWSAESKRESLREALQSHMAQLPSTRIHQGSPPIQLWFDTHLQSTHHQQSSHGPSLSSQPIVTRFVRQTSDALSSFVSFDLLTLTLRLCAKPLFSFPSKGKVAGNAASGCSNTAMICMTHLNSSTLHPNMLLGFRCNQAAAHATCAPL